MEEQESKKKIVLKEIKSSVIFILQVVVIAFLITNFIGQRTVVDGESMENTLQDGDNLIVDKISYRFTDPERFDIIVFPHMNGDVEEYYIKRIIGVPGDFIRIDEEGTIYINEEPLDESYGKEVIVNPGTAIDGRVLRDEEYFVLGDNRNNSMDSRYESVGVIYEDDIIGKAVFRIYPFSSFGLLD